MRLNKDILIPAFILLLGVLLAVVWLTPGGLSSAPDLRLVTLDKEEIDLQALRGKPVLVTFWATTCPSCLKEMPHLIELYHELHPKGLELIGIAMPYDRREHVEAMVKHRTIPYPIVLDSDSEAVAAFGQIQVTPSTFLIDPDGKIVMYRIGPLKMKKLRSQIVALLPNPDKG